MFMLQRPGPGPLDHQAPEPAREASPGGEATDSAHGNQAMQQRLEVTRLMQPERHPTSTGQDVVRYRSQMDGKGGLRACGPTALSEILHHWDRDAPEREQIDAEIRKGDFAASLDDLKSYAEELGFRTAVSTHTTIEELVATLEAGVKVLLTVETGSTGDANFHYVGLDSTWVDGEGIRHFGVVDPFGGAWRDWTESELLLHWSDLQAFDQPTGVDRVMLSVLPGDDRQVRGLDGVTRTAGDIELPEDGTLEELAGDHVVPRVLDHAKSDFLNGWQDLGSGVITGATDMLLAIPRLVTGSVAWLTGEVLGRRIEDFGDLAMGYARDAFEQGSLPEKVAGVVVGAVGVVSKAVGFVVTKVSNVVTKVVDAVVSGIEAIGSWIGGLFGDD